MLMPDQVCGAAELIALRTRDEDLLSIGKELSERVSLLIETAFSEKCRMICEGISSILEAEGYSPLVSAPGSVLLTKKRGFEYLLVNRDNEKYISRSGRGIKQAAWSLFCEPRPSRPLARYSFPAETERMMLEAKAGALETYIRECRDFIAAFDSARMGIVVVPDGEMVGTGKAPGSPRPACAEELIRIVLAWPREKG